MILTWGLGLLYSSLADAGRCCPHLPINKATSVSSADGLKV
jgi:hypothetical protein